MFGTNSVLLREISISLVIVNVKDTVSPPERCDFTSSQQYNNYFDRYLSCFGIKIKILANLYKLKIEY